MCKDCAARAKMARDALFQAKIGEALGHVAKGAAELVVSSRPEFRAAKPGPIGDAAKRA